MLEREVDPVMRVVGRGYLTTPLQDRFDAAYCARTCGCQDKEPAHKHSKQHVLFSGVALRKTWAMWTLKWGAKSGPRFGVRRIAFSFRGPQNGVHILVPILRSTLSVFFSQRDAEKGHPRVGCL